MEIKASCILTKLVDKDGVTHLYLELGYYGWKMNGLQQAIQLLGLDRNEMAVAEAFRLVARLKYPQPKQPHQTTFQDEFREFLERERKF